jgi:hypothetical protein
VLRCEGNKPDPIKLPPPAIRLYMEESSLLIIVSLSHRPQRPGALRRLAATDGGEEPKTAKRHYGPCATEITITLTFLFFKFLDVTNTE